MNIKIRKATLTDSDQMFSLVSVFATSFEPDRKSFDHSLKHLLNDDLVLINVAVAGDEVVGYCLAFDHFAFYSNGRVTWVEEIMVKENIRGKGLGGDLMKSVEDWALSRESKLVGLATRRAAPFYKAIGYEESAIFFRKLIKNQIG